MIVHSDIFFFKKWVRYFSKRIEFKKSEITLLLRRINDFHNLWSLNGEVYFSKSSFMSIVAFFGRPRRLASGCSSTTSFPLLKSVNYFKKIINLNQYFDSSIIHSVLYLINLSVNWRHMQVKSDLPLWQVGIIGIYRSRCSSSSTLLRGRVWSDSAANSLWSFILRDNGILKSIHQYQFEIFFINSISKCRTLKSSSSVVPGKNLQSHCLFLRLVSWT